jgi:gas vesicle protein
MGSAERQEAGNLWAFVMGAMVGAGVALLLTPESGSAVRGLLRDFATRAKDELDDAVDHSMDAWNRARDRGEEILERGKESLDEAGHQVKEFAEEGRRKVNEAKDELSSQHR